MYCMILNGLVDKVSGYHATGPGLNPQHCVLIFFGFAGFLRQMDNKVHHLKILEFFSLFTGKMAPEKTVHLPFALLPFGLFAGIMQ